MSGEDLERLARELGAACTRAGARVAAAESCTGGGVAAAITEVAGSSAWFERGFVTYSNEAKQELLGVSAETLRIHGAVSAEVAREMAAGALQRSRADASVAITGIAGPGGGTPGKPVGLVWFAWATRGDVTAERAQFEGSRAEVRRAAVRRALEGLIDRVGRAG